MSRRLLLLSPVVIAALLLLPLLAQPARAATPRTVTASAECSRIIGDTSGLPKIEVTITNKTGSQLSIAYLRAFGTSPEATDGITGLKMEEPPADKAITIEDGEAKTIVAPWAGLGLKRSDRIVALVLTNAGLLLPACGDDEPATITLGGAAPEGAAAAKASAAIGAAMIGQLEAWRAYPALFALMHPDGQTKVSFKAMSCWYVTQFGPPVKQSTKSIFATEVASVKIIDWTWGVTGARFKGAAEVVQTQTIGVSKEDATPAESTIHLVEVDGVWRWFFGSSPDGVAGLSDSCKLPSSV